jgi:L-glyceraldehyde 3-phosphate reductase
MLALDQAVRLGKALYVGISAYDPEETHAALEILRELRTPVLIHQPRYSMLDRRIEDGLLDVLAEEGLGCIVFSPLEQGLLTNRYLRDIPAGSRASKAHGALRPDAITDERRAQLVRLNAIAAERGQSLAQLAIAWVLRHETVTSALIGASRVTQIDDGVTALDNLALSDDELRAIDEVLAAAERIPLSKRPATRG